MKKQIITLSAILGVMVARADFGYDAGEAMAYAINQRVTSGEFTDANGAGWRIGVCTKDAPNDITPFYSTDNAGWAGFSNGGPWSLPFAYENNNGDVRGHGAETGSQNLQPGEICVHPNDPSITDSCCVAFECTIPMKRAYTISLYIADLNAGGGDGIAATLCINGETNLSFTAGTSADDVNVSKTLDCKLKVGDKVMLVIDPRDGYGCDSTLVRFSIANAISVREVIAIDIDGRQPSDQMPATYTGEGVSAPDGSVWNSFYGVEGADHEIVSNALKTVDGKISHVYFKMTAGGEGRLTFDNNPILGNAMLHDYLYTGNVSGSPMFEFGGLQPNSDYRIYFYTTASSSSILSQLDNCYAYTIFTEQWGSGGFYTAKSNADGTLTGTIYGDGKIVYGIQIIGDFGLTKTTPLVIIIR